ncbi:MAG: beta-ketoacyl synthase [Tannerella sp.]|jgi:3-oxoacyl-[acyl-carrier-protein] synthase-1|nr:beta-ketoacyl synthase [Tannerella sp.]
MTILLGDNIISALGFTTEENYRNVKRGVSGLHFLADRYRLPEPFMASEIDDVRLNGAFEKILLEFSANAGKDKNGEHPEASRMTPAGHPNYSKLEKASIVSVAGALKGSGIDPSGRDVLFILSTTKGNIFLLNENGQEGYGQDQLYLWRSAELTARFFGNSNRPLVVSSACISGASAIIAAQRELRSKRYDYVIVVGADVLSEFIVTGFQSFKALSREVCKPFDANRTGLNIGEAVATLVMTECPDDKVGNGNIAFTAGAVRNDANHISGPSRTGEGACLALRKVLEGIDPDEIAFVCAHGTATLYNDEMESIALTCAGLQHTPVNSLKGYYGHTLGAAGVMESIISVHALKDGTILKTYGFETLGVTNPLDIVTENRNTAKRYCIKMLSGFGGCNVAVLFAEIMR